VTDKQQGPAAYRMARLWHAADLRRVPLRTIITAVVVVAVFYLAGKLVYRLRDVVLIMLVAGFVAVILNPLVLILQRSVVKRRGFAVTLVTLLALLVFLGLALAFGYPLVNAITNLENSRASVELAKSARDLAQKRVDAEQKKYELGIDQIFFVLAAQTDLTAAESQLVNQTISYRLNQLALLRALGTLLDERRISVQ